MENERFCIGYTKRVPEDSARVYGTIVGTNAGTVGDLMSLTITTGEDARFLVVYAYWSGHTEALDSLQIELGSAATEYEACQAQTLSVTFAGIEGAPEPVYGGTLTVHEDGSGTLTVDHAMVNISADDFTDPPETASTGAKCAKRLIGSSFVESTIIANNMVNHPYSAAGADEIAARAVRSTVFFYNPAFTDLAAVKAWFSTNPTQVAGRLETPVTYAFTAEQLTTLLGRNNVSCDAGVVTMTYTRDLGKVISGLEARLTALEG